MLPDDMRSIVIFVKTDSSLFVYNSLIFSLKSKNPASVSIKEKPKINPDFSTSDTKSMSLKSPFYA